MVSTTPVQDQATNVPTSPKRLTIVHAERERAEARGVRSFERRVGGVAGVALIRRESRQRGGVRSVLVYC